MRISDWSSDVCSSDLSCSTVFRPKVLLTRESVMTDMRLAPLKPDSAVAWRKALQAPGDSMMTVTGRFLCGPGRRQIAGGLRQIDCRREKRGNRSYARLRSEEHTSELQSLMRSSYAVFCLKKKKITLQQEQK